MNPNKHTSSARRRAVVAIAGLALTIHTAQAAPISVSSYTYGTNAESLPQPTDFQNGSISDVGNVKLTDGVLATGSWNDGTNVGFRNDTDNGNPQPQVTLDLGALYSVSTIDIWSVSAFLGSNESVSISSSTDGVSFSPPVTVNPIVWTGGFANTNLRQGSIDVSSLPGGRFYRLEVFDPGQWMMINEVAFDGEAGGTDTSPPTLAPADIVDDQGGGPVLQDVIVTYTVTFSDDMDDTTVDSADFDNAGTASISIGTITETGLGIFTVEVTPTSPGTLELRVPIGATMTDDAGNPFDASSEVIDDDSITIDPPDTIPPTLLGSDIVDNKAGGPVNHGTRVTYTVFFNEDMDHATVDAADFGNAGTSNIVIGTITETFPGEFTVEVTPTDAGTLQLEVVMGATLTDPSGNPLDTTSAITDDTTITVEDPFTGSLAVSSYVYGANAESQPQPTDFQNGSISDVGNVKLTDGVVAANSWNDGTNVGFRNDSDNGNPQPQVTFDLGALHAVATVEVFSVTAFLGSNESASISSSVDGVTFSAPVTMDPLMWTGGFPNSNLVQASVDVSSLPAGQFYRLEVFDPGQWMMINEVVFYPGEGGGNNFSNWIAGFDVGGQTGFNDDPDADGSANGLENFFGTDPGVFSPGVIADSEAGSFSHPQNGTPADDITAASYTWSKDLMTWHASGETDGEGTIVTLTSSLDDPEVGTTTVTSAVSGTPTRKLFIRVGVDLIIPPPPLLDENFDAEPAALPAGWVAGAAVNGTEWEVGTPSGVASGPLAPTSPEFCAGTNINGYYTENTDVTLTSPSFAVPAGASASVSFRQLLDTDVAGDAGAVRILDADNADAPIAGLEIVDLQGLGSTASGGGWEQGTLALPAADVGGKNIKIRFEFVSDAGTTLDGDVFGGFYIDDVLVTLD